MAMMQQQDEYRLDPAIAASLRVPARTDLTRDELIELKRLDQELEALLAWGVVA